MPAAHTGYGVVVFDLKLVRASPALSCVDANFGLSQYGEIISAFADGAGKPAIPS